MIQGRHLFREILQLVSHLGDVDLVHHHHLQLVCELWVEQFQLLVDRDEVADGVFAVAAQYVHNHSTGGGGGWLDLFVNEEQRSAQGGIVPRATTMMIRMVTMTIHIVDGQELINDDDDGNAMSIHGDNEQQEKAWNRQMIMRRSNSIINCGV